VGIDTEDPLIDDRPHLLGLIPSALQHLLESNGQPCRPEFARRIQAQFVSEGRAQFEGRRPVPQRMLAWLEAHTRRDRLEVIERAEDPSDGFVKYLFRHPDGAVTEAVRIPLKKEGCFTVCLSSQVGCAMGCVFCATGRLGLTRNLRAWEMVAAWLTVRDEAPGRVTGAVFQGQGEPLHNYDAVMQAAEVLSDPCGGRIRQEAITISTVGLVPAIRRFAEEKRPYRLIVSLTSAVESRRAELLPVAGRFAMSEVREAIAAAAEQYSGRFTVAMVMLSGVNTGQDEVDALAKLVDGLHVRLNLIDVNDARENGYDAPDEQERRGFIDRLQVIGAPIVRRYSGGKAKHAACGMLAATRQSD
jgi:23S rRNA (adenine2503-C2)-methyltransferase